jgi:hypothetical protein
MDLGSIHLAQDGGQWSALLNTVKNLLVLQNIELSD